MKVIELPIVYTYLSDKQEDDNIPALSRKVLADLKKESGEEDGFEFEEQEIVAWAVFSLKYIQKHFLGIYTHFEEDTPSTERCELILVNKNRTSFYIIDMPKKELLAKLGAEY